MPVYRINIKWMHEKFNDVEVDTDASPLVLKEKLYSLISVPPQRQKIIMPGGILGDSSYSGIKLRDGITVMVMGTAEELPPSITQTQQASEISGTASKPLPNINDAPKLPVGIVNIGNTCYMNSALQLLYSIPEIRAFVKRVPTSRMESLPKALRDIVDSLRLVFNGLSISNSTIYPQIFLEALHRAFPQFATRANPSDSEGSSEAVFQQQDANECWIEIVRVLQQLRAESFVMGSNPTPPPESFGADQGWNPVDRFLTGSLVSTLTCTESDDEPPQETVDTFSQLSCFIVKDVKYLHTGIRNGLEGTLTKNSTALGREAVYKKVSRISRLPGYLCIQFVRFFYKEKEKVNAKILKDVKFPMTLDLFEFCTKELQDKLLPEREKSRLEDEAKAMAVKCRRITSVSEKDKPSNPEDNPELYDPYWLPDDLGSNNTGFYDLQGVVSHQGRMSMGHYVAWIKQKNRWFKMDDTKVSEVAEEDILKLSGGGEYHSAYILLYGPRRILKVTPESPMDVD